MSFSGLLAFCASLPAGDLDLKVVDEAVEEARAKLKARRDD